MKKIFFFFCALLLTMPMLAQTEDDEVQIISGDFGSDEGLVTKYRKNKFLLGPKFGGVITSMSQPNEADLYDGSGFGISAGLAMKMRFGQANVHSAEGTGFWGVGLELKYKQNKVKTDGYYDGPNTNFTVNYLEIPLYFHVYPFAKSRVMNSLYVEVGASFGLSLGSSPTYLKLYNPNPELESITYRFDKLKGHDFRPIVGLGYTIPYTGLDINARYYIGTSKLAGNFPCKMNSFEISLAWMFNMFKF